MRSCRKMCFLVRLYRLVSEQERFLLGVSSRISFILYMAFQRLTLELHVQIPLHALLVVMQIRYVSRVPATVPQTTTTTTEQPLQAHAQQVYSYHSETCLWRPPKGGKELCLYQQVAFIDKCIHSHLCYQGTTLWPLQASGIYGRLTGSKVVYRYTYAYTYRYTYLINQSNSSNWYTYLYVY